MTNKPNLLEIREWVINTLQVLEIEYAQTPVIASHFYTLKEVRENLARISQALKLHIDEIIRDNVNKNPHEKLQALIDKIDIDKLEKA